MANLGTLWFGADVDLTKLKQKIQSGNQSILDALKISFDQSSYQNMVNKLRSELSKETFQIKVTTNTNALTQNLRNSLNTTKGGFSFIDDLNRKIMMAQQKVASLNYLTEKMHSSYLATGGSAKRDAWMSLKNDLGQAKMELAHLTAQRTAYNNSLSDSNKRTKQASNAVKQLNSDHVRLNATLAGGLHISTRLGSALSGLFAVDAARQFLGNVIEIGGQLEKQRISIGAILGDTVKANHLFEQIKGLALQSPFGVVELDQYTKQLSAYGFKYSELFDMTKRLADISAGAGTDIGRLTLALGHVRSATYLTGITLRQFSMNNIPMLKMLADYYSEVEKHAVSTADVQKRISKRQVSYEDVIEQIRRLTDEGGMFFNMQEKISESLAAKYKNLKDAMDIMYGEMAEGYVGDMLKELASILLKTTRHWKEISSVMGVAAAAFMISKLRIGASTLAMQGNTAATIKQILATKQLEANNLKAAATYRSLTAAEKIKIASSNSLTVSDLRQAMATDALTKNDVLRLVALKRLNVAQAMHLVGVNGITAAEIRAAAAANKWKVALAGVNMSLKNAFAGVGAGTWATIGAMAGMALYSSYSTWVERIEGKATEMKDLIKSRINDLQKIQKTLENEEKPKEDVAMKNRINEMKQVLANSEAYTETLDQQLSKTSSMSEKYDILAEAIGKAVEKNRQMLDYQDRIAEMIKASSGNFMSTSFKENLDWFLNDDITQNMKQTLDAYKDLRSVVEGAWEYKEAIKGVIEEMMASNAVSEDFKEQLRNAPFEEQIRLLAESGYWGQIKDKIIGLQPEFVNFANKIKEASNDVTSRWDEIANDDIPRMLKKEAERRGISEKELHKWCLENIDDFKMMLDGINDQLGVQEPSIRRRLKRMFYDYVAFSKLTDGTVTFSQLEQAQRDALSLSGINDNALQRLLDEDKKADLHDDKTNNGKNNGTSKKDEKLEAARTRLAEYKAFLSEYKKYREMYDKEKAVTILSQLFPNLKDEKGNFLGGKLVDNYTEILNKLRDSLPATTEARKKFINEINKTTADTALEREKEVIKENADAMEEYIKKMQNQWKLYQTLLSKSGGNREFATMAFSDGVVWDETAKQMLEKFNSRLHDLNVIPVGLRWDMNEQELRAALVDAKGQVQTELVKMAQAINNVITGNYAQFLKDSAEAYEKSLTEAEKLTELERQRNQLIRQRDTDNDQSETKRRAYNTQIAAKDKQIASQKWEAFKETEEWGRIFSNLDNISNQTLQSMLDKLTELAPKIRESAEGTKAVYEAMDKIKESMANRNPFTTMINSLKDASALREYKKMAKAKGGLMANKEISKLLGVPVGKKVNEEDFDDELREAENDFTKGLQGLASGLADVQSVLQPVIDLFDALGEEDLGNFFSMGSNAIGAAANAASGLSSLGLGSLGPYGAAAAAGLSIATSIVKMHDEALQKEIEASEARQKEMENLTDNLKDMLDKAISGIYGLKAPDSMLKDLLKYSDYYNRAQNGSGFQGVIDRAKYGYISEDTVSAVKNAEKTKTYYDAVYASMLAQRDELLNQMRLEDDKKDSDANAIADYKQQLYEMEENIKYFAQEMANEIYGIDFKSYASELAETLVNAWVAGENGAEAYKQKVSDILKELGVKMITERFVSKALEPIMDEFLDQYEKDDGTLTMKGMDILSKMYDAGEKLQGQVNGYMEGLEAIADKNGSSLKDIDKSSSTSSSIKGITEEKADLLGSYINSIRADVAVNRAMIAQYYPQFLNIMTRGNAIADSQVVQLTQIADNTRRNAAAAEQIYDLLHRVSPDGTAIKIK